ncbi:MAG TPA: hypothetical protein VLT33_09325 [Labilithrix sp.]|nr:hypothetical protein [Labilithrix sp.]
MRPNLSLESIAGALAVLGTGVIMAACGGEAPKTPVDAKEVPGATDKAAGGDAAHCGAGKDHKAGEASCSADHKADAKPADPVTAAAPATPATPATPSAADAKGVTGTPAPATTGTGKKPAAPAPPAAAKKAGASSCGAGTCSAKK